MSTPSDISCVVVGRVIHSIGLLLAGTRQAAAILRTGVIAEE